MRVKIVNNTQPPLPPKVTCPNPGCYGCLQICSYARFCSHNQPHEQRENCNEVIKCAGAVCQPIKN
jgi:hypothetical protein